MSLKVEHITMPKFQTRQSISQNKSQIGMNISQSHKEQELKKDFLELCLKKKKQREAKKKATEEEQLDCY
jgi:hypothetical protein